ncbi:hypothetical protein HAX54_053379, partial [Datura stramonium]|nr:hypothetical protein [Datura stramonium]
TVGAEGSITLHSLSSTESETIGGAESLPTVIPTGTWRNYGTRNGKLASSL